MYSRIFFALGLAVLHHGVAYGQPGKMGDSSESDRLVIGVSLVSPMVTQNGSGDDPGTFGGFDVELWGHVADDLNIPEHAYSFRAVPFADLIQGVENGTFDLAMAGVTLTREREQDVDFSMPYSTGGIGVLVRYSGDLDYSPYYAAGWSTFKLYLIVMICAALLIWFAERKDDHIPSTFWAGIEIAFYFCNVVATTVGFGDFTPKTRFGRWLTIPLMWSLIVFAGIIFAKIQAIGDLQARMEISAPEDVHGRTVAVLEGTTSVEEASRRGAIVVPVSDLEDAYDLLYAERVDAVIFDEPALRHHTRRKGAGRSAIATMLKVEHYGFVLPSGSTLRERVNRALLKLMENGVYDKISASYFGGTTATL